MINLAGSSWSGAAAAQETDVGPVLRQLLTRAENLFGGLFTLTLCDELVRGQVPE